jgi:hypothetical protein
MYKAQNNRADNGNFRRVLPSFIDFPPAFSDWRNSVSAGGKWKQLSSLSWFNTRLGKFWERHCGTLMFARAQRHRHLNIARTFGNNSFCNWNVNIRNQGVRIIDPVSTDRSSKIKEKARSSGFHSNICIRTTHMFCRAP